MNSSNQSPRFDHHGNPQLVRTSELPKPDVTAIAPVNTEALKAVAAISFDFLSEPCPEPPQDVFNPVREN